MKKWIALLIAVLFFVQPIAADVLVTPEDEFFLEHEEECHGEFRHGIAQEEVILYKSPISSEQLGVMAEGERFYVDFSYIDPQTEELWYVHTMWVNDRPVGAWMKSEGIELQKTEYEFFEENKNKIKIVNEPKDAKRIYFTREDGTIEPGYAVIWEYPNSPYVAYYAGTECAMLMMWHQYTDDAGVDWAYVTGEGRVYGWVNMNQLTTMSLDTEKEGKYAFVLSCPEEIKKAPVIEETPDPIEDAIKENAEKPMMYLGGMIFGVVVLTGLLIKKFWGKKTIK